MLCLIPRHFMSRFGEIKDFQSLLRRLPLVTFRAVGEMVATPVISAEITGARLKPWFLPTAARRAKRSSEQLAYSKHFLRV